MIPTKMSKTVTIVFISLTKSHFKQSEFPLYAKEVQKPKLVPISSLRIFFYQANSIIPKSFPQLTSTHKEKSLYLLFPKCIIFSQIFIKLAKMKPCEGI